MLGPVRTRRGFLLDAARLSAPLLLGAGRLGRCGERDRDDPVERIDREVLWNGRAEEDVWFHPRPCTLPGPGEPSVLMTLQSISGSDYYGQVHWTRSDDLGRTWSEPEPIAALGRRALEGGVQEGICDVVPQHHPRSGTVLAIGHNVYYAGGRLTQPYGDRHPWYVVGDGRGGWSERRRLEWDHPDTSGIYTCGCAERLVLEDGDLLIPVSHGPRQRRDRAVTSLRCAFDGETVTVLESGRGLRLPVGRGLLEPSLVRFGGEVRMTIRAEDGRGYHSLAEDGLAWSDIAPWRWDDGEELVMSTTQQHWLARGEHLYLVYTRKDDRNERVMRYRAPLYMAAVDPDAVHLVRESERVLLPLRGDPAEAPEHVARMGNFHTLAVRDDESWVTVGESRPASGWKGDLLLARIRWGSS